MAFRPRFRHVAVSTTLGAAIACYGAGSSPLLPIPPADPAMGATDLPCDVAAIVARDCASCHGATPKNGAPMSLVTADAFRAKSTASSGGTIGDRSVIRMKDAANPMPPYGALRASDVAIMEAWVSGGVQSSSCASPNVGVRCASGNAGTGREGPTMRPGDTCIHCHAQEGEGEAPIFEAAGTVYSTLREPTPCVGASASGADPITVELKDKNGKTFTLGVNSAGNFSLEDSSFTPPYTARVLAGGRVRVMKGAQVSGECNGCHAEPPAGGAPGRVLAP